MRFMMVKAYKDSEAGKMPSEELLSAMESAMEKDNEELLKAGVLLDLDNLAPKGPASSSLEKSAPWSTAASRNHGYWVIQVKSREEALEWPKRAQTHMGRPGRRN